MVVSWRGERDNGGGGCKDLEAWLGGYRVDRKMLGVVWEVKWGQGWDGLGQLW